MRKDESGSLLIPLVIVIVLFLGTAGFAIWAFVGMQDYKNNSDQKSAVAVAAAEKALTAELNAEFEQKEKKPVKPYVGPSAYGSLTFDYPKTWSGYVITSETNTDNVNGYMAPGVVPDVTNINNLFALRFKVTDKSYAEVAKTYEQNTKTGSIQSVAYQPPKVPEATGLKLSGFIDVSNPKKTGTLVLLPLRDKTLQIWTDGDGNLSDLDNIILPSLTFVP